MSGDGHQFRNPFIGTVAFVERPTVDGRMLHREFVHNGGMPTLRGWLPLLPLTDDDSVNESAGAVETAGWSRDELKVSGVTSLRPGWYPVALEMDIGMAVPPMVAADIDAGVSVVIFSGQLRALRMTDRPAWPDSLIHVFRRPHPYLGPLSDATDTPC